MSTSVELAQLWRGGILESRHMGHAVICNGAGEIVESWGDPDLIMFPRSSCKMIQALPLVEGGAELTEKQLALVSASHNGAHIHTDAVTDWLSSMGLDEGDLRCGPQEPADLEARDGLIRAGENPCQLHNNCSGKHAGFLMLNQRLGGGAEYVEVDHPVQKAVKGAMEDVCGEDAAGYGVDGCSAPNFAVTLAGLARGMGYFASAHKRSDARSQAAARIVTSMGKFPEMVAGEGRACTALMRAMGGRVVVKTGAEAVFTAILPEQGLGIALKVSDGTTRGAELAIVALLIKMGVLDAESPVARTYWNAIQYSRRGIEAGILTPGAAFA
ncbi:asparaginase [Pseudooceanicola sp. C21-150M6]|uniref:asparaginase n=1 Tax=Pseudooceanicola sp. C21-150M6 TaxID=3434355 RepID=UPI003D7F1EA3